ncbi:MAG: hypothetical protein R3282_01015, partial [Rhodothermales bacterium]|nr:hypothetical protein [Rhodothermales bacterium]
PVVLVVWLLGHATLSVTRRLAETGAVNSPHSGSWPIGVVVVVVGAGVASFVGMLAMAWPFLGGAGLSTSLLPVVAFVWGLHVAAFVGMLLRKAWARRLAAGLLAGWGSLMSVQVIEHLWKGRPTQPLELLTAATIVVLHFWLAIHLLTGKGPRRFTTPAALAPTKDAAEA